MWVGGEGGRGGGEGENQGYTYSQSSEIEVQGTLEDCLCYIPSHNRVWVIRELFQGQTQFLLQLNPGTIKGQCSCPDGIKHKRCLAHKGSVHLPVLLVFENIQPCVQEGDELGAAL